MTPFRSVFRSLWNHVSRSSSSKDDETTALPLHRSFMQVLDRHVDPWPLVTDLIVQRLGEAGVTEVSPRDRRRIEEGLRAGKDFRLGADSWKWWQKPKALTIQLTEADGQAIADRIQGFIDQLPTILPRIMPQVIEETTPDLWTALRPGYLADIRNDERAFRALEAQIADAWREPLESLALLIEVASRIPFSIDEYYEARSPDAPHLVNAVTRLHTRGIHIAREVLRLLQCGYADAASARWRTLHEVTVVACFLSEHGEPCAVRYLDHNAVEEKKAADEYQKWAERLNAPRLSDAEIVEIRSVRDAAVDKHKNGFKHDYGWAIPYLRPLKRPPKFADIEEAVDLGHLRPFYRLASHNVHASPKGILFKLGAVEPGRLLVGPSPAGLADPGEHTALTLALLTTNLLTICPVMDVMVAVRTARLLADEAADRFVATGESLEIVPGS